MVDKNIKLSASKIKTLQSCSWLFWCSYFLNLPDGTNSGALRGKIIHDLFEILTKKKKLEFATKIIEQDNYYLNIINRFIRIKAFIYDLDLFQVEKESNKNNFILILEMINLGLSCDFLPKNNEEIIDSEHAFDILDEELHYRIIGFIDKLLFNKDSGKLLIIDYKSSKRLFEGEDLHSNVQAMMYSLAAHILKEKGKLPNFKRVIVRFLFLRFVENPYQDLEYSMEQLEGFKHFLSYIQEALDNFTEENAKADFAADYDNRKWLCGYAKYPGHLKKDGSEHYYCPYKFSFNYYVLLDENKKVQISLLEDDFLKKRFEIELQEGFFWEKRYYSGCPRWNQKTNEITVI